MMTDIIVDTNKLNAYARRLGNVTSRIKKLDQRISFLSQKVGWKENRNGVANESLFSLGSPLIKCQEYCFSTADDFEAVEKKLSSQNGNTGDDIISRLWDAIETVGGPVVNDIMKIIGKMYNIAESLLQGDGNKNEELINLLSSVLSRDMATQLLTVDTAGEALGWLENLWDAQPKILTHAVDVWLPSSLKDAYKLTSGVMQGDLTGEDIWKVTSSVLSKNPKLNIVCEAVDYAIDRGQQRTDELEEELMKELMQGDLLGACFEGAEGFVDTIIGGSIEVSFNVAGDMADTALNEVPIIKSLQLNKWVEYGTGLLGLNDGKGYSVGGIIGRVGEAVSDTVDAVTDFVTDATNVVTDAIVDVGKGAVDFCKSAIGWIKGWF